MDLGSAARFPTADAFHRKAGAEKRTLRKARCSANIGTLNNKTMPCMGRLTMVSTKKWNLKVTTKAASAELRTHRHFAALTSGNTGFCPCAPQNLGRKGRQNNGRSTREARAEAEEVGQKSVCSGGRSLNRAPGALPLSSQSPRKLGPPRAPGDMSTVLRALSCHSRQPPDLAETNTSLIQSAPHLADPDGNLV